MKNQIVPLLEYAESAIRQERNFVKNSNEISKEYQSYISSFGASVMQSGLLPALYFNHNTESQSAKDRKKLMNVIYKTLQEKYRILHHNVPQERDLLEYAKNHPDLRKLQKEILDAATAVKLVIRTYKLI